MPTTTNPVGKDGVGLKGELTNLNPGNRYK